MAGEYKKLLETNPEKAAEIRNKVKSQITDSKGRQNYFSITTDKLGSVDILK